ncbi:hypothetical protein EJB05_50052, partial [Eragrostis curvula]
MEKEMVAVIILLILFLVALLACLFSCKREPVPELEQWAATALAAHEALATEAAAIIAEQAVRPAQAAAIVSEQAARPVQAVQLPYFPYAANGRASETLCAICVEPIGQGQLCSEVPTCRHALHGDCLGEWAKSKGTCPLRRAKIVPGLVEVSVADDIWCSSPCNGFFFSSPPMDQPQTPPIKSLYTYPMRAERHRCKTKAEHRILG